MTIDKYKLVIWDLDETFWRGTLSDKGGVIIPKEHIDLINNMIDNGVMCSICSKNDEKEVFQELEKYSLNGRFVFCSINWSPKGARVKQIVSEMNLRQPNVLFIDDNPLNRAEVLDACPDITVADVDIIEQLIDYFKMNNKKDLSHSRLNQYKVLEEKREFQAQFADNESFLYKSNIQLEIKYDCEKHIERIVDLIQRSNQLNFTKVRSSAEEIDSLLNDSKVQSGYVEVQDKFGDYGIVGYFAVSEGRLIHFTFSCRTLGMGVEQYVYKALGYPTVDVIGEVASDLYSPDPKWINLCTQAQSEQKKKINRSIVLKGPCDMQQMFAYIAENRNIQTEFVYVSDTGVNIDQVNHSSMVLNSLFLSQKHKEILVKKYPFSDKKMFNTSIFDEGVEYVVYSLFTDPNLGLYYDKELGAYIAYGEYTCNITDKNNWPDLIRKRVYTANCSFSEKDLQFIAENLTYCDRIQPEDFYKNIKTLFNSISKKAHLILILGSETQYDANTKKAYADRHIYHQKINKMVRELCEQNERLHCIDVNSFISGQDDFVDNINHFKREIYYKMSIELARIIEETSGVKLRSNGEVVANIAHLLRKIKKIPAKTKALFL